MAETQPPDNRADSLDPRPDPFRSPKQPANQGERDRKSLGSRRGGPAVVAVLVVLLIVLYQDNWFWESDYLVFGFMPIGLFYHAMLSVAASLVWLLATRIAWPVETVERAKMASKSREVTG